jgi:hypothetical protein
MVIDPQKYKVLKDVAKTNVEWLWYPYVPCGKITVLQGDPGCGKSMMVMDLIARLTSGRPLPNGKRFPPMNVIYQCSEDGYEDTIKPRLERLGADDARILWINEDFERLSLDDDKIKEAMVDLNARLLVIDPFQAYLGDSDLTNATGMRRVMTKLSLWASACNCAVVLVGHFTKRSCTNELYRGLGSVDIVALARSVLQVELSEEEAGVRHLRQVKSSLAAPGGTVSFRIEPDGNFRWHTINYDLISVPVGAVTTEVPDKDEIFGGKLERAAHLLIQSLSTGPKRATVMTKMIENTGMCLRTVKLAKMKTGIVSFRKDGVWYWKLPTKDGLFPKLEQANEINKQESITR